MKKLLVSAIVGLLVLPAALAFAQMGLPEIEKLLREQEAKLATVRLEMLHMDITAATGRAIDAFQKFLSLEKKIKNLPQDHTALCAKLPTLPYAHVLHETQASAAEVGALLAQAPALVEKGGTPSAGMQKLMASELAQVMGYAVSETAKLRDLFSDLEISCSKEG